MAMATIHTATDLREAAMHAVHTVIDPVSASPVEALGVVGELRAALDHLVTEFVVTARRAGATWAEIGSVLGVSTQAAHQRYRHVAAVGRDA